ncbi:MAG TPA: hypothetical protein VN781_08420 [Acidimicrobiales bacterium]|nr:hypothetical protein [Acidimicrobiales bacterium]
MLKVDLERMKQQPGPNVGRKAISIDARRRSQSMRIAMVALAGSLFLALSASPSGAQNAPVTYTMQSEQIGPPQSVVAALYQPTNSTPNESTALVVVHQIPVFAELPCPELAQRGFTVVCTDETGTTWDQLARGVGYGVAYARSLPGIRHVVLLGWSGGGSMVAYYQNIAENGVAVCQAPHRLDPCTDSLAGLPRADGVVFLDAIPGLAFSFMSALDASTAKAGGLTSQHNPSLYLFNQRNGYNPNPNQSSRYSLSFIERYTQAQGQREAHLVSTALRLEKQFAKGRHGISDAMAFPIGHDAARIWQQDTTLLSHTKGKYPLITPASPNGTVQVVHSVRVPAESPVPSSPQANDSSPINSTVSTFLSTSAIMAPDYRLTADSIEGVDWASSNTSTVINVQGITVPLLMMSMTGHYWVVPSEMYYLAAHRSKHKTLAYVEGAAHVFSPCTECQTSPNEFGDTEAEVFNYVGNWLEARF